jgi:outer membrane DcaP-like protein
MRSDARRIGVLAMVALCALPGSTRAQTATSTEAAIAELRQMIADQRAVLDRQAQIIEEQGRTLTALRQQVEGTRNANPATPARRQTEQSAEPEATLPAMSTSAVGTQPPASQPASRTAAERAPDLPTTTVAAGDFPGSIRIPGTESALKLGGQARMVAVHSLRALGTDDRFVTSSIPVGTQSAGEDARTTYSPTASRLSTELRMPSPRGPLRTFIESDFAGSSGGNTMRLRHAFIQTNRFVVGQTWSTFSDPEAEPIGIDFEGLNAISLFRQPQIRWTRMILSRYDLALALENPSPDLTGAQGVNLTPDFIVRLRWEPDHKRALFTHAAHVQAAVLVRQLRGEVSGQPDVTLATGGFGANISGVLVPRWDADDRVKFAANAGSGIGRYIADLSTLGGQDAVYDSAQVSLRALSIRSGYFGYERVWSPVFTTAVTYGLVIVNNLDIQLDDALHRTQRTSINLTWNPIPQADVVLEFLAGTRINKNGERGFSSQIQAGWTFKF